MKVTPLQALIGFKAIGLALGLKDSDRRIAFALLDHFNRATGQCDPSLGTLSALLGISERTAIRATIRLEAAGLIRKTRHGGNFHRNHYELCWPKLRELEADWTARRQANSARFQKSPSSRHKSHPDGDNSVTQTCSSNRLNVTSRVDPSKSSRQPESKLVGRKGLGSERKPARHRPSKFEPHRTSSSDAARTSAQRRWDADLLERVGSDPGTYASIIDRIDELTIARATEAELQHKGGGLAYLVQALGLTFTPRTK